MRRWLAGVAGAVRTSVLVSGGVAGSLVVVAVALTTGGGGTPGTGETSTANLWVDQSGGTCIRQPTAGAYVNAAACGSIQAAYTAASCGDVVGIKGGAAYGAQDINATAKDCSSGSQYVTFTPATGENVVFGGVGVGTGDINMCNSATWIKFLGRRSGTTSNFTLLDDGSTTSKSGFDFVSGGCGMGTNNWVHHIWVQGLSFEQYVSRGADYITLKDNDISPGKSNHHGETIFLSMGYNGGYVNNYATGWVIEDNDYHGFNSSQCVNDSPTCHVECLTMEVENITIRRNRIWDCGNSGGIIFSSDGGGPSPSGLWETIGTGNLVENNVIASRDQYSFVVNGLDTGSKVTVRFNTFRRNGGGTSFIGSPYQTNQYFGTMDVIGNVINDGMGVLCADMTTFAYNVVTGGGSGCHSGGTGNVFSTETSLTDAASDPGFHLAAAQPAQDLVPPASCAVTVDLDGETRPNGTNCDAGADER